MEVNTFGEFVKTYGWLVLLVYFLIERVWPWMSQEFFPQRFAERLSGAQRIQTLEERQVAANEKIAQAVVDMTVAITSMNEKVSQLMTMHIEHDRETSEGIAVMRERTAAKRPPTARTRRDDNAG